MLDFFPSDLTNIASLNSVQVDGTESSAQKHSPSAKVCKEFDR